MARRAGRDEDAARSLTAALDSPAEPFARYALACLGREDLAAIRWERARFSLTTRAQARLAIERFCARQASPGELLDHLDRAATAGYRPPGADHWRRLARLLARGAVPAEEFCAAVEGEADAPRRRNLLRAAAEVARGDAIAPLAAWAEGEADTGIRQAIGARLLCAALEGACGLGAAQALLGPEPRVELARALLSPGSVPEPAAEGDEPLSLLWRQARQLAAAASDSPAWLREQATRGPLRHLARLLLLHDAVARGDPGAAAEALDDLNAWADFPTPPRTAVRAAAHVLRLEPQFVSLKAIISRWLRQWPENVWPPEARSLAVSTGAAPADPRSAEPPDGPAPARWLLHQAALAAARRRFGDALVWARRALALEPELADAAEGRGAMPELETLALAEGLDAATRAHPDQPATAPELLADAVRLLADSPGGAALLDAVARGDAAGACRAGESLAGRDDLTPALAHHLALILHRGAVCAERRDDPAAAATRWAPAWRCWMYVLADGLVSHPERSELLLRRLLGLHREQLGGLLARELMERARGHWDLVHGLPALALPHGEALARLVAGAAARFRDELATEYLTATREAMRHGAAPEGWRADYEGGLAALKRLLSLDRDNVRLLTALAEICGEWFFDCYTNHDWRSLTEAVNRFTPFALKLTRLVEGRPAELAARAALSEFCKFRGAVAADNASRVALYREALRFNPGNLNARELLDALDDGVYRP